IHDTCTLSMPLKRVFKKSVPWWSNELTIMRKEVNKLRRKFQRAKDKHLRNGFKRKYYNIKIEHQKLIEISKVDSWKRFCNQKNPWDIPYKMCNNKIKINTPINSLKMENGEYTDTPLKTMQFLIEKIFPDDDINDNETQKRIREESNKPID